MKNGRKDGWMLRGGLPQGLVKGRQNEGNKKKRRTLHILCLFILRSSRLLWQQQRPVYCLAEWSFEPWAMLSVFHLHISLPPSILPILALSVCVFNSIKLIYITQTNTLIIISPGNNLLVNLNSGK